ncbi:RAM1 Protein farnesyltransferase subunit beta [Candida maltosa Xu316]
MLTDDPFDKDLFPLIVNKVEECLIDNGRGGIAGGSNQLGHVASSYSGILTLVITKQYELLDQIRFNFYEWLMKLKLPNGSFMMHEDGESDTRSTYCVLVIANLLNIATDELLEGVEDWIDLCQTYEGGFSNIPNTEAHGGYTFCAVASYFLLHSKIPGKDSNKFGFSLDFLTRWCVQRQHELEGGFDGRTNKLVDACYSFWVGALFPMVELLAGTSQSLFDREGLRHYILRVAQEETGGFRDKPGKGIDFYHTNYTLSGLSIVEHSYEINDTDTDEPVAFKITSSESDNLFTKAIHPIFGIPIEYVNDCRQYFASKNNKK